MASASAKKRRQQKAEARKALQKALAADPQLKAEYIKALQAGQAGLKGRLRALVAAAQHRAQKKKEGRSDVSS